MTDGLAFPGQEQLAEEGRRHAETSAREEEYEDERTRLYAAKAAKFFEAACGRLG